jgi:hypothetical protein
MIDASLGILTWLGPKPCPVSMVRRFVPNESNSSIRSALPEADNPKTPTNAAIPIVMPSVERAERSFLVLSPEHPTRKVSNNPKWLFGTFSCFLVDSSKSISRFAV